MLASERHDKILRALRTDGPAAVRVLADRVGASQATVRRDLVHLADEGRLTRVYGGAVAADDADQPFADVSDVRSDQKDAVADACAALILDGEAVLLDIGTTTYRIARRLHGRRVTVMTTSLAVFEELQHDPNVELMMLGGVVRRSYRSLVGFLAEESLKQVRADRAFLGTSGVRRDGSVTDTTVVEVPVKRGMIAAADQVVLAADAGKFPGTGKALVCAPTDIDVAVTNQGADAITLSTLADVGVEVVTV
ncbi:DeoR/GlpR family DNA-binding transcription regulator [Solicola gregarius]|uniref:DeoR/GlpR family DNA-binding transcription regulator n=1 Tax=Solicola gregarius TaxID=2908642 RepID=A0AA46TM78_9ACTN|nr:DeoR/GlpR family DNA-binding transcription regulator [Solicola gregarius]UYM07866.1 DeoR/GlpR family DNA-binding transcription regulator [Solicola gregarius]